MSTESPPEPKNVPSKARTEPAVSVAATPGATSLPTDPPVVTPRLWLGDAGLIVLFLGLTFLLGMFPLKDADFHWHLRTGDLIRQSGQIPQTDTYTFTRDGAPWIDLHWIFQVSISWVYEHGGVVGLNLAKCGVTTLAVFLLITARRRGWPVWAMLLAWLPGILVLSGRMYVRPETFTLLYLAIFLAVIIRWDRHPWPAWILPVTQVAWVNSHGLFVLGPIVLVCALLDAAISAGSLARSHRRWWRIIGLASLATGLACLVNPYGIHGAIYPMQLAATMQDPIFSKQVAELTSIPDFIASAGWRNLPLQLQAVAMLTGALSFLIPLGWSIATWFTADADKRTDLDQDLPEPPVRRKLDKEPGGKSSRKASKAGRSKAKDAKQSASSSEPQIPTWRLSLLRLLLFVAFSVLSLRATRNSHQFAAVVGTITAWNFGEWVYVMNARRANLRRFWPVSDRRVWLPRLTTAVAILAVIAWVGSGWFYAMTGEKRVVGLHEEPLWFPHEAAKFAGGPGMPERFVSFHNANASVFEYYNSPDKKVYTDPRLELAGAKLFKDYLALENAISAGQPGWEAELDALGRPSVMTDHEFSSNVGAAFLRNNNWRMVWFDPIVAVFVHEKSVSAAKVPAVDFLARHFQEGNTRAGEDTRTKLAVAKAIRNYVSGTPPELSALRESMALVGLDESRDVLRRDPSSTDAWKVYGQIEFFRQTEATVPRYRSPFNPVVDLSTVVATTALKRALELSPSDFFTLWTLRQIFDAQGMYEAALPMVEGIASLYPINKFQSNEQRSAGPTIEAYRRKLGSPPATTWQNLGELDQIVSSMMDTGRVLSAAELLERANPPERAPWDVVDRIATLRFRLGDAAGARSVWQTATVLPSPALRDARVAATYLAEADFARAEQSYAQALSQDPGLFEAHYGIAVLKRDAGDAAASLKHAESAIRTAPDQASRKAAEIIARSVRRFAKPHEDLN